MTKLITVLITCSLPLTCFSATSSEQQKHLIKTNSQNASSLNNESKSTTVLYKCEPFPECLIWPEVGVEAGNDDSPIDSPDNSTTEHPPAAD